MELALKILAGVAAAQLVAMVLVVWLVVRRPAGITPAPAQRPPIQAPEKPVAFFQGPMGTTVPPKDGQR